MTVLAKTPFQRPQLRVSQQRQVPRSDKRSIRESIDKSELAHPEPRRVRDREHVRLVIKQPCLICGRTPSDPHHLRFAQYRALGRKVSDEFTVPLCRGHHREVHRCGDEAAWWQKTGADPAAAARALWLKSHPLPTAQGVGNTRRTVRTDCGCDQQELLSCCGPVNDETNPIDPAALQMTSFRQIEANRRNSAKSTGPQTEDGKQRSRCNAIRHGLTAETVIGALEDVEDYQAFEAAVTADYDAQSAVERELVLRLASLLWRLRRATTIETGLFEIQADHVGLQKQRQVADSSQQVVYALFGHSSAQIEAPGDSTSDLEGVCESPPDTLIRFLSGCRTFLLATGQSAQLRARSTQPLRNSPVAAIGANPICPPLSGSLQTRRTTALNRPLHAAYRGVATTDNSISP